MDLCSCNNTDETIRVINKYEKIAKVPYNRSQSLWMLKAMKDMIFSSGKKVDEGELLESDFNDLTKFFI